MTSILAVLALLAAAPSGGIDGKLISPGDGVIYKGEGILFEFYYFTPRDGIDERYVVDQFYDRREVTKRRAERIREQRALGILNDERQQAYQEQVDGLEQLGRLRLLSELLNEQYVEELQTPRRLSASDWTRFAVLLAAAILFPFLLVKFVWLLPATRNRTRLCTILRHLAASLMFSGLGVSLMLFLVSVGNFQVGLFVLIPGLIVTSLGAQGLPSLYYRKERQDATIQAFFQAVPTLYFVWQFHRWLDASYFPDAHHVQAYIVLGLFFSQWPIAFLLPPVAERKFAHQQEDSPAKTLLVGVADFSYVAFLLITAILILVHLHLILQASPYYIEAFAVAGTVLLLFIVRPSYGRWRRYRLIDASSAIRTYLWLGGWGALRLGLFSTGGLYRNMWDGILERRDFEWHFFAASCLLPLYLPTFAAYLVSALLACPFAVALRLFALCALLPGFSTTTYRRPRLN